MMQRALLQGYSDKIGQQFECSSLAEESIARLSAFFEQLNESGFATIKDTKTLARAVKWLSLAMRETSVLLAPEQGSPTPDRDGVHELIERAVFGR
jgi:hypothetical protein